MNIAVGIVTKICQCSQILDKLDKNNNHFMQAPVYIYDYLVHQVTIFYGYQGCWSYANEP